MIKKEYSQDPTEIDEGDTLSESEYGEMWCDDWQFCGICHETISQPVLKGIWYHNVRTGSSSGKLGNPDHPAIPADALTQLFLMYEHHGNGTRLKLGKYDDKETKACPCYLKWFNLLRKKNVAGFQDSDHYYNENGISACGTHIMGLNINEVTEADFPEKVGYSCEDCIKNLIKRKLIKIITYKGKSNSKLWDSIEWLKT